MTGTSIILRRLALDGLHRFGIPVAIALISGFALVAIAPWTSGLAQNGSPASEVDSSWEKPVVSAANASNMMTKEEGTCPKEGLGGDIPANIRKNRVDPASTYHDVDLSSILRLPVPSVGHKRKSWSELEKQEVSQFEGVAVRSIGFISKIKLQSRGTGEAANCYFTLDEDVDWHVLMAVRPNSTKREVLVTEITPRVRALHPGWTVQRLQPWIESQDPIRVSGWVLFDSEHQSQAGMSRATPWEIHPITKIEVQKNGNWQDLDLLR